MDNDFKIPQNLPKIGPSASSTNLAETEKEIIIENAQKNEAETKTPSPDGMEPPQSLSEMKPPAAPKTSPKPEEKEKPPPKPKAPEETPEQKQAKYAAILSSLKYHSPEHGAPYADPRYGFEVLKTGTIVDRVKFRKMDNKGFYVVGRVPACDVVAENPTVSRTHAILQFIQGPPESAGSKKNKAKQINNDDKNGTDNPTQTGLYVFDLNATHGTFINKNQVYPNRYYRLHVGHVLKFGNSTRLYVLLGPEEDEEEESEKSVTELQNERLQKELERKRLEAEGILVKSSGEIEEDDGCGWGMAEDAEEETDNRENPFAINFEESESFDNPKRTLRGWFEREGHDLVYEVNEKNPGQFICKINLPVDGPGGLPVFAEVDHKGKKKEAVHQAALQACQILDKYGVLRQAHTESKSKKKERNWQDEDYYSSDEDTFLDRTGSVEKKREKRMQIAGKVEEKVETYESLCSRGADLQNEIDALKTQIEKAQAMNAGDDDIDIDDYVNSLKAGVSDVKKLKTKLRENTEELKRVNKLINIVKPAILPISIAPASVPGNKKPTTMPNKIRNVFGDDEDDEVSQTKSPMSIKINMTPKDKKSAIEESTETVGKSLPTPDDTAATELKDHAKSPTSNPQKLLAPANPPNPNDSNKSIKEILQKPLQSSLSAAPKKSPQEGVEEKDSNSSDDDDETVEKESKKRKKRNRQRQKFSKEPKYDYDESDPKYSTWVPPQNQAGDGRTSLNEKLGY